MSSPLLFLSVQRSSVWGQRRLDSLPTIWWPDDVGGATVKQPHRHRSEAVAVQTVAVMIPLDPEVTVRDSNIPVLVAQSPDEVSLQANDPLDDLLLGVLGGHDGDDVTSLDLVVPHTPTVQQDNVTIQRPIWVQGRLHRRSLHSRHVGKPIEDSDSDWNGDKEPTNERPQVALPR